jgi:putative endonuclease
MNKYFVYIIYNSKHDKYYIGQTNNIERRVAEHNDKSENKYTSKYLGGWKIVYKEEFDNRKEAIVRKKFLKKQKNKEFYKKLCNFDSVG